MKKDVIKILKEEDVPMVRALFGFTIRDHPEIIQTKFRYWARFFYPKFFPSKDAPFHKEMDLKTIGVYTGSTFSFLNIAFRGSSKTTRTKLFTAFAIANDREHYRKFFKILTKDYDNAKQFTTDVYNLLINKKLFHFYPDIFQKTKEKREETMTGFTTATGIKIIADTVGTDQRGDIQDEARPDFVIADDFETKLSLTSQVIGYKIWQNMEEARTGLAKDGGFIYLANYFSERGNVHKLVQKIDNKIIVPIERDGVPTWPERYTPEDIQKIKKEADDFEGEYMCRPEYSKEVYFDRTIVERQVPKEPVEVISGLKIFKKYNPIMRVGSGHDVGGGVGLDSSTSVFLDFDSLPIQVIATYKNNEIKPDAFAYEILRQCNLFGQNYCGVEKNYGSTIDILKTIYPLNKIHQTQRSGEKILYHTPLEYGWETNAVTKTKMLAELASLIDRGLIELNDKDLIAEVKSYTRNDLLDREPDVRLATQHFDLLIALAIAVQMNPFIKKFVQHESDPFIVKLRQQAAQRGKSDINPAV